MKPKKLLSFMLATAMTISLLPTFTLTASASETPTTTTEKNITLGATALKGGQASNVYFGSYQQSSLGNTQPTEGTEGIDWIQNSKGQINNQGAYYRKDPIKWRVLSNDGSKLFLLSDKNLDVVRYHEDYEAVTWATSTIRSWLNGYEASSNTGGESGKDYTSENFIGSAFSENEKKEIVSTTVEENIQDKVFLLSIAEAQNTSYFADNDSRKSVNTAYVRGGGKTGTTAMYDVGNADYWWLRSPGDTTDHAARVNLSGGVDSSGGNVYIDNYAVRPAFNLNLSSVLFTSAAVGGKSSTAAAGGGAGIFENVDLSTLTDNDGYKLTMLDESRKDFSVTEKKITAPKGGSATFSYENAKTDTNEYISAMLLNKDKEVLYYGQIKNVASSSETDGKATVEIPASIDTGTYTLRVFNEQINGDKKTDFSSDFSDITLNVVTEKNITLGTAALSGYDSTNGYKYVYYGTYNSESVKWRVLDMTYKYDTSKTGMLVLSENALAKTQFGTNSTWSGSTAQTWCNSMYNSSFGTGDGTKEQDFILGTTSTDNILSNDYLFFLSDDEASNSEYFPNDNDRIAYLDGYAVYWWLRSPANIFRCVCCVDSDGLVYYDDFQGNNSAARPAFNLDRSSILFTTPATVLSGGKDKSKLGLKKNSDYSGNEYKLTIVDTSRTFSVTSGDSVSASKGENITIQYSEAVAGENEYISAMILDKTSGEVLYYGQGEKTVDENETSKGTVKFTLPNEIENGEYTLYVFNEHINDDEKTDISSAFHTVTLNVLPKATFTTDPTKKTNLTYDGTEQALVTAGETSDGTVRYSLSENGTYTTDIPKGINADTYTVWYYIEGNSSHSDSDKASIEVTIAKADSQTTTTADETVTYGEKLTLTATVTKSARTRDYVDFYVGEDGDAELLGTVAVTYTNGTYGTATLTIDTKQKQLKIGDNKITAEYGGSVNLNGSESDTITVKMNPKEVGLSWSGYENLVYDGNAKSVTATTTDFIAGDDVSLNITDGDKTNADTYTATASLSGENAKYYTLLTKDTTQEYTINPKTVTATISDIADQTYTGGEIKPTITAYDGTTVIPTSEYTVGYSDNMDAGTATVTLTDNTGGNYVISGSKNFTISKKSIENATLVPNGELTYNGQPQTQNVTLTLDGFTNVTFDVSGNEQTNVKTDGDYTLTVTGTGNFSGRKTLDWNIKPYTPAENPNKKTTARVRRGRTLANATVTNGEMLGVDGVTALEGTFAWVDDTKAVSADGTEQMTFTPNEEIYGKNYATMTIDVAVSTYSSGGGGTSRYTVKFDTDGGNTITNQTVTKNSKATEPSKPTKEGYIFDGWYTDSKFTTEYDFDTKVTKNITLYAKWVEDEVQEPSDDKKDDEQKPTTDKWKNPFADVTKDDWFFDNVRYANENGLMSGLTNTEFAPNEKITRGMFVTVLYRAEGEPAAGKSIPFADVNASQYYANAVIWAEQNGIVKGVSETEFAPDENITREQIAAIIYRYAKYKGIAPTGAWAIKLDYDDVADISDYAVDGVMYCTMKNIMQGKDNNMFAPKDNATRAEIAAILNRFIENNK